MMHKMTYDEWAERLHHALQNPSEYSRWMGVSPGGAAGTLKVTRQRIWQLVKEGKLDMVLLSGRNEDKVSAWLITDASLARYSKSKPGVQAPLPLASDKRKKAAR